VRVIGTSSRPRAPLAPLILAVLLATGCASAPSSPGPGNDPRELDLAAAQAAFERDPRDEMAAVWLGRRLGYLGRYEDAVAAFTRGLEVHPDSAWLYRFRGHRYITLRRFDDAVRDLERARDLAASRPDEVEPDGAPNKAQVPIGTLRSNIDYHLGLAQYLRGDFAAAWRAYDAGFALARANDDRLVSHTYWSWLTLEKLGRTDEARRLLDPIRADMHLHENESYLALLRFFRGDIDETALFAAPAAGKNDFATRGFGAAMKHVFDGDTAGATELLERVVRDTPPASFGCIAAEVELRRLHAAK
jgi:tetratricopeptide (TPR) repeat protein